MTGRCGAAERIEGWQFVRFLVESGEPGLIEPLWAHNTHPEIASHSAMSSLRQRVGGNGGPAGGGHQAA
jgi:hypothetical protein